MARRRIRIRFRQAFIDEQAAQCGFCLSGVVLTAKAFLDQNPRATEPQIRQAMSGVLCRCFTHTRMIRAITKYAQGGSRLPEQAQSMSRLARIDESGRNA